MQVTFLGYEHNPDLMLLAARALTFLADVFPPACASIIRHGAVPAFCARLLTIEYIDLAEQSLQALEKLSHEHPGSLLRNGALVAVLSYIDFFQTGVQRVAVATAANICRGLTADYNDAVSTAAPILIGLLSYQVRGRWWVLCWQPCLWVHAATPVAERFIRHPAAAEQCATPGVAGLRFAVQDSKIVDSACLALTRIAQAYARCPSHLEMLCNLGLISSIVGMVTVAENGSVTSQLQVGKLGGQVGWADCMVQTGWAGG